MEADMITACQCKDSCIEGCAGVKYCVRFYAQLGHVELSDACPQHPGQSWHMNGRCLACHGEEVWDRIGEGRPDRSPRD